MKIAIIGAGPAGLTAGYELSKKEKDVTVHIYEAGNKVGGMCKTITLWNTQVDIGPHRFFSYDKRVNTTWLEIVGKDYKMVNRTTRIYYKKKFFLYPIKPFDALKKIGIMEAFSSLISYLLEKINPTKQENNFETWVKKRFGEKLYTLFFKTYSEKLWGINCKDLDSDFAAQRIKKLSLSEVIINALSIFKSKNKHKTLIDQFAYPTGGTGMVYERMAERIIRTNPENKIFYNTSIKGCKVDNETVKGIILNDGQEIEYDAVISTMPLTKMVANIPGVSQEIIKLTKELTFRNTIIVYIKIEAINLFPDNWLYVHSPELKLGRITNFRNWIPDLYGNSDFTVLALEYWCNDKDDFWTWNDEKYIELAKEEIIKTSLTKGATITDAQIYRIPNCYPVYKVGYKEKLKPIIDYLKTIKNLYPIGRYGAFKYNNQDHSILMGLMVSDILLNNANHDLWNVNTDYDVYQESTTINETGLVEKKSKL
jgi:protoporphyrinogen oxidase